MWSSSAGISDRAPDASFSFHGLQIIYLWLQGKFPGQACAQPWSVGLRATHTPLTHNVSLPLLFGVARVAR